MSNWRSLVQSNYLCIDNTDDIKKPSTVQISRLVMGEYLTADGKVHKKSPGKKHILYFSHNGTELKKSWFGVPPASVLYPLELMYGHEHEEWTGKDITIYRTKCFAFGKTENCFRIQVPADVRAKTIANIIKKVGNNSAERMYELIDKESQ